MSEAVCSPTYFSDLPKLLIQPVLASRVLIDDIINITYCFVVLDPSSVGDLQLAILDELLDLFLLVMREVVIPILQENNLSDKKFAKWISQ